VPVIACDCDVCRSQDPHDKRLRASALVEIGHTRLLIDAGPDFRYQMLREKIRDVRAILLTHEHKDHIGGLDDVRAFNWVKQGKVDLYCNERTSRIVRKDYDYAFFENKYPGVPDMELHVINDTPFYIDDVKIIPITVLHHRLPVTAFRIANFAYITDVSFIPAESMTKLRGVEYALIGALRKEPHISHFTLKQVLEVVEILKLKQVYITHIGHQMGLHAMVSDELPPNVRLAYDQLVFEF